MATHKISVEVYVPAAQATFDIMLPAKEQLYQSLVLLNRMIPELTGRLYVPTEQSVLCLRSTGRLLNLNETPETLGMKSGTKLILF